MNRLTRDGTAEPVSRGQILRHQRKQGNIHVSCSADYVQDRQPYPVDPYSCYMCDHTTYTDQYVRHIALKKSIQIHVPDISHLGKVIQRHMPHRSGEKKTLRSIRPTNRVWQKSSKEICPTDQEGKTTSRSTCPTYHIGQKSSKDIWATDQEGKNHPYQLRPAAQ